MKRRWGLALALACVLLVVVGGALGFLAYARLALGLSLQHQAVLLGLPPEILVKVKALNQVRVRLDGEVSASMPLRQTFTLPMHGSYAAEAAFDAEIPLHTVLHYRGVVPVATTVDLAGSTGLVVDKSWLPKFPLRAKVPLRFDFPVDLVVPLDTRMRLSYRGPVRFRLDQSLAVPVDTVINTRFHLARDAEAPVRTAFRLRARPPATLPVVIEQAALNVPLSAVRLQHQP